MTWAYCGRREVTAGSFHMIANTHFTKSTFDENSSYCASCLISDTQIVKQSKQMNQSNMQTIWNQLFQLSPALNTVKPAKYTLTPSTPHPTPLSLSLSLSRGLKEHIFAPFWDFCLYWPFDKTLLNCSKCMCSLWQYSEQAPQLNISWQKQVWFTPHLYQF